MAQRSTQRTDILSAARCSDILPESYLRNLSNLPVHRNIAQIGQDAPNRGLAYSTKFRCTCQDKFHFFLENVQFIIMCERANKLRRTYFSRRNGGEAMKYECLKLEERRIIEEMYAKGAKPGEIAERVGKCQATIYRELERGKTGETDSRFRQGYSAAVAEARVNRSYRNRGRRKAAQ